MTTAAEQLRARYQWKRVEAPKVWRPRFNGEELIGFYGGRTTKQGSFGQYDVAIVHAPARGAFIVSGSQLLQLVDAALLEIGAPVRIVWRGWIAFGEDRRMKSFDLFVPEGEHLSAEDLPEVRA